MQAWQSAIARPVTKGTIPMTICRHHCLEAAGDSPARAASLT